MWQRHKKKHGTHRSTGVLCLEVASEASEGIEPVERPEGEVGEEGDAHARGAQKIERWLVRVHLRTHCLRGGH